mgnify:CR=1 FL=1
MEKADGSVDRGLASSSILAMMDRNMSLAGTRTLARLCTYIYVLSV